MSVYINMLREGMIDRGHKVDVWKPIERFYKLPLPKYFKKWLGYIDQFIIFPFETRLKLRRTEDTIFVFADNALGPWVPLVRSMPHVIHCHDFIALDSANGLIDGIKLNFTGRLYQKFILKGLKTGRNYISVSLATKNKLERLLNSVPILSEVVYNGINKFLKPLNKDEVRQNLSDAFNINLNNGYILHVGGNLWYKNRRGVIELYNEWRTITNIELPLIIIGEQADFEINILIESMNFRNDIYILEGIDDQILHEFYSGASLFLFPSIKEGFGWPIAEAMACGCMVITTNLAPMNEVGGDAALYIPCKPNIDQLKSVWIKESASFMNEVLNLSEYEKALKIALGIENIKRFDLDTNLNRVEVIYQEILRS